MDVSLQSRNVAVTGACGTIGYEICREVLSYSPRELAMIDRNPSELYDLSERLSWIAESAQVVPMLADVCDRNRMNDVFEESKPQVVFHTSAYDIASSMESNPGETVKHNVFAAKTVADLSLEHGVDLFVLALTDEIGGPHSVVAMTKRLAGTYVHALARSKGMKAVAARLGPAFSHPHNLRLLQDTMPVLLKQITGMIAESEVKINLGADDRIVDLQREPLPPRPGFQSGDVYGSPTWGLDDLLRRLAILRSVVDRGQDERLRRLLQEMTAQDEQVAP